MLAFSKGCNITEVLITQHSCISGMFMLQRLPAQKRIAVTSSSTGVAESVWRHHTLCKILQSQVLYTLIGVPPESPRVRHNNCSFVCHWPTFQSFREEEAILCIKIFLLLTFILSALHFILHIELTWINMGSFYRLH